MLWNMHIHILFFSSQNGVTTQYRSKVVVPSMASQASFGRFTSLGQPGREPSLALEACASNLYMKPVRIGKTCPVTNQRWRCISHLPPSFFLPINISLQSGISNFFVVSKSVAFISDSDVMLVDIAQLNMLASSVSASLALSSWL